MLRQKECLPTELKCTCADSVGVVQQNGAALILDATAHNQLPLGALAALLEHKRVSEACQLPAIGRVGYERLLQLVPFDQLLIALPPPAGSA